MPPSLHFPSQSPASVGLVLAGADPVRPEWQSRPQTQSSSLPTHPPPNWSKGGLLRVSPGGGGRGEAVPPPSRFFAAFQVSSAGAAARDGRLRMGLRILEVNQQSLLGMTHAEAVQVLRAVGDRLLVLVCEGFDPKAVAALEVGDCLVGALPVRQPVPREGPARRPLPTPRLKAPLPPPPPPRCLPESSPTLLRPASGARTAWRASRPLTGTSAQRRRTSFRR